jgi:hypothetical protein
MRLCGGGRRVQKERLPRNDGAAGYNRRIASAETNERGQAGEGSEPMDNPADETAPAADEVTYVITDEDVRTYYDDYVKYYNRRGRRSAVYLSNLRFYLTLYCPPVACLFVFGFLWPHASPWSAFVLTLVVCYILLTRLLKRRHLRLLREFPGFMGENYVWLSAKGYGNRDTQREGVHYWHTVRDIVFMRHHILIIFGQDREGAFPIPLRAFADEETARAFFDRAVLLWKNHRKD